MDCLSVVLISMYVLTICIRFVPTNPTNSIILVKTVVNKSLLCINATNEFATAFCFVKSPSYLLRILHKLGILFGVVSALYNASVILASISICCCCSVSVNEPFPFLTVVARISLIVGAMEGVDIIHTIWIK